MLAALLMTTLLSVDSFVPSPKSHYRNLFQQNGSMFSPESLSPEEVARRKEDMRIAEARRKVEEDRLAKEERIREQTRKAGEVVSKANANTPTVSSIAMDTSQDSDVDDVTDKLEYLELAEYDDFGMCSALNLDGHYDDEDEEAATLPGVFKGGHRHIHQYRQRCGGSKQRQR